MKSAISLFLAALVALCSSETLDLGDLKQYHHDSKISLPKLTGNAIWISKLDGDGYDIALSPDTQSQVRSSLSGCEKSADNCFNKVKDVIHSADVEFDNELDSRAHGQLVSRFIGILEGALAALIASLIAVQQRLNHAYDGHVIHLPQVKVSEATKLEQPTKIVISAQGSAVITITPTPNPTKIQGSQTPSITPVTAPHNGFAKGDLDIILDQGLAARIDEIMHRMGAGPCEDGIRFDKENGNKKKRSGPSYGGAICAAEAAAVMAHRGAALNDLLYLGTGHLTFGFKDTAGAANRAAQVVNTFIQAFAPQVNISPELAEQLANLLFALAMNTIMEKRALGHDNRIDGSLITTSSRATSTATATGCPDPKQTALLCGQVNIKNDCDLKLPKFPATKPVCKSGKYKDCACVAPILEFKRNVTRDEFQIMTLLKDFLGKTPICNIQDLSKIPSNVFSSEKNNIYHHFCDKWHKDTKFSMRVDAAGNNKDPEPHMKAARAVVQRRTPPPNPDTWKDYDFWLNYTVSDTKKDCLMDCKKAFRTLAQACNNNGAMNTMAQKGIVDVDCGKFAYNIAKEASRMPDGVPYDFQSLQCNDRNKFGKHNDIQQDDVAQFSRMVCDKFSHRLISKEDASKFVHEFAWGGKQLVPLWLNIFWRRGCVLQDGTQKVDLSNPLQQRHPHPTTCAEFLFDNYKKCNNGGVGGYTQVGCLIYEFSLDSTTSAKGNG